MPMREFRFEKEQVCWQAMPLAVAPAIVPDGGDGEDFEEDNDVDTAESQTRRAGATGIFVVGAGVFPGLCQVRPAAQRPFTSPSTTITGRHGCALLATHTCANQNKIQTFGVLFSRSSLVPVR